MVDEKRIANNAHAVSTQRFDTRHVQANERIHFQIVAHSIGMGYSRVVVLDVMIMMMMMTLTQAW
jgi:hypothetical protein